MIYTVHVIGENPFNLEDGKAYNISIGYPPEFRRYRQRVKRHAYVITGDYVLRSRRKPLVFFRYGRTVVLVPTLGVALLKDGEPVMLLTRFGPREISYDPDNYYGWEAKTFIQ